MITDTAIPKIGEEALVANENLTQKESKLEMDSSLNRSVFGLANLQQGMIGHVIPADALQRRPINGSLIVNGTIAANKLVISNGLFVSSLVFSTSAYNVVSWTSGTIQFANGATATINSGTTGALSGTTARYIYYSRATTTTLQVTTDMADIVGDSVLLCIVKPQASTAAGAVLDVVNAKGTTISGNSVTTGIVQSADGNTYFDLENNVIIMNDGTNDRLLIGKV